MLIFIDGSRLRNVLQPLPRGSQAPEPTLSPLGHTGGDMSIAVLCPKPQGQLPAWCEADAQDMQVSLPIYLTASVGTVSKHEQPLENSQGNILVSASTFFCPVPFLGGTSSF